MVDNAEVVGRLDTLIRLQAMSLVSRYDSQKDKIIFLSACGMTPKLIADLLGTTPATVSNALQRAKKPKAVKEQEALDA